MPEVPNPGEGGGGGGGGGGGSPTISEGGGGSGLRVGVFGGSPTRFSRDLVRRSKAPPTGNAPQAIVRFGGVAPFLSFSMTFSHGITPSVATLVVPPLPGNHDLSGDLVLGYGRTRIAFPDSRIDRIDRSIDAAGREIWRLTILDRRWRWRINGAISGQYNTRRGLEILPATIRTPQQLAALCLEAMGESRYDVRQLPNETLPEVDWDYINPSEALARLCDSLACRVVLTLDNAVRIVRLGQGAELPRVGSLEGGTTLDPPDPPSEIRVVGERDRFQANFRLEAVGLEVDGSIKPVDQLSYAPQGRRKNKWVFSDVLYFVDVKELDHRRLAQQSVYRWYRIRAPFDLPGIKEEIVDLDRVLPLLDAQLEWGEVQGRYTQLPPWVYGRFWDGDEYPAGIVDDVEDIIEDQPKGLYTGSFDLDAELGIVKFAEPVYRPELTGKVGYYMYPADLRLRVACTLRDQKTNGWLRSEFSFRPDGRKRSKTIQYVVKPDIQRDVYQSRKSQALIDTRDAAQAQAKNVFAEIARAYSTTGAGIASYPGFVRLDLDGAIHQISWQIDDAGFGRTRIARNREDVFLSTPYEERRFVERTLRSLRNAEKTQRQKNEDASRS